MASTGYFRWIAPEARSSTRCLSVWPFPALALVTAFGPSSAAAAAAAPAAAPSPADFPTVQAERRERGPDLRCVNSMRVRFPGLRGSNRLALQRARQGGLSESRRWPQPEHGR